MRKAAYLFVFLGWGMAWVMPAQTFMRMGADDRTDDTLRWPHPRFSERAEERRRMVEEQIAGDPYIPVRDKRVLAAMEHVPRHLFVPEEYREEAYEDHPLPIGYGQTISQPLIVAHMTQLLQVEAGDRILEVGTGSGYQAAVLAELTPYVFTIEIIPELAEQARTTLHRLGYTTVKVKCGDGYEGWPEHAPYDGIIVTCAPEAVPQPLIDQLKPGGRIVIPVGPAGRTQWLFVMGKTPEGKLVRKKEYPVAFVPMTGKAAKEH